MIRQFLFVIFLGFIGMPALGAGLQVDAVPDTAALVRKHMEKLAQNGFQPTGNPVGFYKKGEPYYEFANFHNAPISLDGTIWPTSEHYFQAQKFTDPKTKDIAQKAIRSARTPREAFDIARKYEQLKRKDWDSVKDEVMLKAVDAKFTQHADLKKMLLDTGEAYLVEASPVDPYWGSGSDGTGENMLGLTLMKVRDKIRRQPSPRIWVGDDRVISSPASPNVLSSLSNTLWFDRHILIKAALVGCIAYGIKLLFDRR